MANCDDLNSLLPLDNCYNFAQQSQLWNTIRDIVCATCTITVPSGTSAVDFACFWEAADGFPDPQNCPVLTVIEGCNLWFAPNDPLNCDLGECPAVPGTGTDWVTVGETQVGSVRAVLYVTDIIEPAAYVAYGVGGIVLAYQNILIEDIGAGSYNNAAGVSRWTANKSGLYRISFSFSIRVNLIGWGYTCAPGGASSLSAFAAAVASFASSAIIASPNLIISTTTAPPLTGNFYEPYAHWGFAPAAPAGVNMGDTQSGFDTVSVYMQAGQYIDFFASSLDQDSGGGACSAGTRQWRPSNNAYAPHAAFLLVEEITL